jgi:hypothetical protein
MGVGKGSFLKDKYTYKGKLQSAPGMANDVNAH